jgi:hypothetical protein
VVISLEIPQWNHLIVLKQLIDEAPMLLQDVPN